MPLQAPDIDLPLRLVGSVAVFCLKPRQQAPQGGVAFFIEPDVILAGIHAYQGIVLACLSRPGRKRDKKRMILIINLNSHDLIDSGSQRMDQATAISWRYSYSAEGT